MAPQSDPSIQETAADWLSRMVSGTASVEDQQGLDNWLAADPRHQGAYLRAQAMWTLLDAGAAEPAFGQGAQVVSLEAHRSARFANPVSRRLLLGGSAALAASLAAALWLPGRLSTERQSLAVSGRDARSFALSDGSRAILDVGARVEVAMRSHERRLELLTGVSWFQVAKDKSRPFIVEAGGSQVIAVGTEFSVSREGGTRIIVTEGIVKILPRGASTPIFLRHNDSAFIATDGRVNLTRLSDEEIRRQLAWREGSIGFNGETLKQAAEKMNDFNDLQIVIDDPDLAETQIVGWFSRRDAEGFAQASATMAGMHVERRGKELHLKRR